LRYKNISDRHEKFPWDNTGNNNIGVFVDENLTFNKHAQNLSAKSTRSIICMKRVAHLVSLKALNSLHFALGHSHLLTVL
jgi:hypothetical protein